MADETSTQQVIHFFHGDAGNIAENISNGKITASDFVVTTDDELVYIDKETDGSLSQKTLGNAKVKENITVIGTSVGNFSENTVISEGTDLTTLLKQMLTVRQLYKYVSPTISVSSSVSTSGEYEVGDLFSSTITGTFTKNDAGNLTQLALYQGSTLIGSVSADDGNKTKCSQPVTNITIPDSSSPIKFTAKATYEAGPYMPDNLGDDTPNPIAAGTITSSAISLSGRRGVFYGSGSGEIPTIDEDKIRNGLYKSLKYTGKGTITVSLPEGSKHAIVAYPKSWGDVSTLIYHSGSYEADLTHKLVKQNVVSVHGANDFTAIDYNVYTYLHDSTVDAETAAITLDFKF